MATLALAGCGRHREAAATTATAASPSTATVHRRPDVVLVTIDTLRADAVGFGGNRTVATPILDRLAAAGTVFTNAHAQNVVTLPSHTNILTGLYPFQHGVRDNDGFVLPASTPTLATMLRQAGYVTGAFVGAFPLDRRFGLAHGFDVYDDSYPLGADDAHFVMAERRGDVVVAAALAWWREHAGKPRFLWVHVYDPHAPYAPPEPFRSRYRDRPYLGEVAAVDSFLAPLLVPHLQGKEPPALVVVTGDHGEALGDHGELTHGLFAYESTLHVPLVVWGEAVPARRDDRLARHIDIVPTVLARLAIQPSQRLPGRSLLGPAAPVDSYFEALSAALNRGWAPLRGDLRGGAKLIDLPIPELYELPTDPAERVNLATARPAERQTLMAAIPAAASWPPSSRRSPGGEEAARLTALGYAVGNAPVKSSYGPEDDPKTLIGVDHDLHQLIDLYSRQRYEDAVRLGRQIVAAHPDVGEAYENLALALRQLERGEEAVAVLREGMRKARVRDTVALQLGMTLAELGRASEAVEVLQPLAAADPDPETLRIYATAMSDAGDQAGALQVLARAATAAPDDPRILEAQGTAELRRDNVAAAQALLQRAVARSPRLATAWNTLGVALFRSAGPQAAIDAWQRAFAIDPTVYDALYNTGLVAADIGQLPLARQSLQRFVATAPPQRFGAELAKARGLLARLGSA